METNLSQEEFDALVRDAMLWRSQGDPLRAACEAAYKHIADRPHDAQWEYDEPLRHQLEEALKLKQWEKYT